ncbi:MAG TPA: hypothetical protein VKT29_16595, partial [Terriglobales bacterium]|nr:hypothetical protein [Terriglobales bacterium]
MSRSRVLRASVLSGVVFAAALTFASGHYTIEDLSALPGGSSVGAALNSSGQVVGWSGYRDGGNTYAFVWTHGVAMYSLRTLAGGDSSSASGINASGAVAGTSNTATSERAFLWTRTGGLKDLGVLPGDFSSSGSGLNDRGDVVGVSTGPQFGRPTLWMSGAAA